MNLLICFITLFSESYFVDNLGHRDHVMDYVSLL